MKPLCAFGKSIKFGLIERNKNQTWLIREVREQTGLYFDSAYMHKILTGELATASIVGAIRDILDIPEEK